MDFESLEDLESRADVLDYLVVITNSIGSNLFLLLVKIDDIS